MALSAIVPAFAQEGKVNFPSVEMNMASAIQTIEQQSKYVFVYQSELLAPQAVVVFSQQELLIKEAVKQLLAEKNLDYKIYNKYIIIYFKIASIAPAPRTDDVYQSTDVHSIDASPLYRPVPEKTEALEISEAEIEQIAPPAYYSSYYPPDGYINTNTGFPKIMLKTNLLYLIGTLTPNLELEFGTGPKTSLLLSWGYNPWSLNSSSENNDKLVHNMIRSEFRYWFCERFVGHAIGVNALYTRFNISGKNIPFVNFKKDFRYDGSAVGAGINYSYHLLLGSRWGLEFSAGAGVVYSKYDLFNRLQPDEAPEEITKILFAPTQLAISLTFLIL